LASGLDIRFVQIAETDAARASLTPVDVSYHQYPYTLLFKGSYFGVSAITRAIMAAREQRKVRADCVVINSYNDLLAWVLLIAGKLRGQSLIISLDSTFHDHPRVWYKEMVKRIFVGQCNWAFCYGIRSKEYLQLLGMNESRISIRCQAAPSDRILAIREDLRDGGTWRNPVMNVRPYFLFVGRLASEKGLDLLLRAFDQISNSCGFDLLIAGAGPLGAELEQARLQLSHPERVSLVGAKNIAELVVLYRDAFFLVLPSRSEPWGLVVNEAFILECPAIVSTSCGCAPDLINSETGFTFAVGDDDDLLAAMRQAIKVIEKRDEMGRAAKKLIELYHPSAAAKQMLYGINACLEARTK
jgi:glycosyltransferase involved in cell wall biosynthesis